MSGIKPVSCWWAPCGGRHGWRLTPVPGKMFILGAPESAFQYSLSDQLKNFVIEVVPSFTYTICFIFYHKSAAVKQNGSETNTADLFPFLENHFVWVATASVATIQQFLATCWSSHLENTVQVVHILIVYVYSLSYIGEAITYDKYYTSSATWFNLTL